MLVDFIDPAMPTGDAFPCNARYPKTPSGRIVVDVGEGGRVTLRFERLLMANFEKARSFVLTGEIVLDCTAGGVAGTAACASRSGDARSP